MNYPTTITCHCGKTTIFIKRGHSWCGKCHCNDCQKISGSGYIPFVCFSTQDVEIKGDSVVPYESSATVRRTYCGVCGSPLTYHNHGNPEYADYLCVSVGLVGSASDDLLVDEHIWVGQKRSWDDICDAIPRR